MIFKKKKESAEELLRTETGFIRYLRPYENILVSFIAVSWAVYQLALASVLILDSTQQRAIHLAFAMSFLFLVNPCLKRSRKYLRFLSVTDRIPIIDYIFAVVGAMAALYLVFDYEAIAMRMGVPTTRDIIVGVILVILLLEATRRVIGPALSVIAILFTSYAFLGPYMPDFLAFKGVSITKYLSNITLSTEGIYGIPLGVSSSIVYLFVLMGGLMDKAGAGRFFADLALSVLGPFKGGPAKAAVLGSGLTGLVSGSSIANIVTTGTFTIPLMKKVGYPAKKAAAVEVAASTDGQLAPPLWGRPPLLLPNM